MPHIRHTRRAGFRKALLLTLFVAAGAWGLLHGPLTHRLHTLWWAAGR